MRAQALAFFLGLCFLSPCFPWTASAREGVERDEPAARPYRLRSDHRWSVYDRALIAAANLHIERVEYESAVGRLEELLNSRPPPDLASYAGYHAFRIRLTLLGDREGALKEAAKLRGPHVPAALEELVGPLEREGRWQEAVEALVSLLAVMENAEAKVAVAERLLASTGRRGDEESKWKAYDAIAQHVDPGQARETARKRNEERQAELERLRRMKRQTGSVEMRGAVGRSGSRSRPAVPVGRTEGAAPGVEIMSRADGEMRARLQGRTRETPVQEVDVTTRARPREKGLDAPGEGGKGREPESAPPGRNQF